jgi:hypothetical protein
MAKTKNKNNICIVNSVLRNQDLIPSKLTHDIMYSYSLHFYILIDYSDDDWINQSIFH